MTYSNTYSSPSSPTNFIPFSGMGMRKGGRPSLFPGSGDGSTLNLDFTTGVLDPRLTFTRASTATFVNSSGYVDHAGANLLLYSAYANTNWLVAGGFTKPSPYVLVTSPANDLTASKLNFTLTGHGLYTNNSLMGYTNTVGATYTWSAWIRATSGPSNIRFGDSAQSLGANIPITTTWTRYSYSYTAVSASGPYLASASGTATGEFEMWGFQLNPGSTAQTYYPTTTAAYYAPRFDYSPTNIGEPRGLLIEGSSINSALYSGNINPNSSPQNIYWVVSGTGASVTPVSQTDPANGSTASRCILGTSTVGRVYQACSTTIGATYTMSFWAKSVSGNTALHFWHYNSATGNYTAVTVGTSWARYQVTVLARSGGGFIEFGIANLTATAATIDLWGMQVELGSGASSYIPTGASGVTRNADHCTIPTSSFISGNPYPQTLFVDCIPNTPSSAFLNIVRVFDRTAGGTYAYGTEIYYYNASTMIAYRKVYASTNTERSFASGLTYGTRHKLALSIDASSFSGSYDGVPSLGVATAPTALATVATHLGVGCSGDSAPSSVMFGTIRQIKFWPSALSQSQINTLTTL